MSARGIGVIYTKTARQQMLKTQFSTKERDELLSAYYRPFHEAMRRETQKNAGSIQ
jgi:N-formylglutamate amidohydrolase